MSEDDMYDKVCKDRFANIERIIEQIPGMVSQLRLICHNTNHYSHRPSWFVSLLITALTSALLSLGVWIVTHGP